MNSKAAGCLTTTAASNQSNTVGCKMAEKSPITQRKSPQMACLNCGHDVQRVTRMSREYCSQECFSARKRALRKSPLKPQCSLCQREYERTSNRQKVCASCKPLKSKKYTAEYNAANAEIVREQRRDDMRVARNAAPDVFRDRGRKWWARNADLIKLKRTSPEAREKANRYIRARYANEPRFAVHVRMANAIHQAIREQKSGRKWESLVDYSLDQLVAHLERQFLKGMSWQNMGEWHIDHIVPKSSFDYASAENPEFKACWALTNLRPMWAEDNQKKHAKILTLL